MDEVFVDSCVLLDIFNADESFCDWAIQTLYDLQQTKTLVINPIIFTEVAFNFDSCDELERILDQLNIRILDIPLMAAFRVSRIFKQYRRNGGDKKSPMPDFYIGAHASEIQAAIVTRDTARFKTYYPDTPLITPSR